MAEAGIRAEPALQRPQQGDADRAVMLCLDPVRDVLFGERACGRKNGVEIREPVDHDRERPHQLAALLCHVAMEQRLDLRGDLKQAAIEHRGSRFGDRRDLGKASLNQSHLFGGHTCHPSGRPRAAYIRKPGAPFWALPPGGKRVDTSVGRRSNGAGTPRRVQLFKGCANTWRVCKMLILWGFCAAPLRRAAIERDRNARLDIMLT